MYNRKKCVSKSATILILTVSPHRLLRAKHAVNKMGIFKTMKLLGTIGCLVIALQVGYSQSTVKLASDELNSITIPIAESPRMPLYSEMLNYTIMSEKPFSIPLSTRMVLSPTLFPDYNTKYQVGGSGDLVGVFMEMVINGGFYLFEQRKLRKYD